MSDIIVQKLALERTSNFNQTHKYTVIEPLRISNESYNMPLKGAFHHSLLGNIY